jgi:hypothetical protein
LSHGDQIEHSVRVKHDILAFKSPGAGKPRARAIGRPLRGGANRAYRLHVVPVEREQRKPGAFPLFQTWVRWQTPVYMLRQRLGFFENEFPGRRSRVPRSRCSRHRFGRAHHVGMGTKSDHEHLRKYWCRAGGMETISRPQAIVDKVGAKSLMVTTREIRFMRLASGMAAQRERRAPTRLGSSISRERVFPKVSGTVGANCGMVST